MGIQPVAFCTGGWRVPNERYSAGDDFAAEPSAASAVNSEIMFLKACGKGIGGLVFRARSPTVYRDGSLSGGMDCEALAALDLHQVNSYLMSVQGAFKCRRCVCGEIKRDREERERGGRGRGRERI